MDFISDSFPKGEGRRRGCPEWSSHRQADATTERSPAELNKQVCLTRSHATHKEQRGGYIGYTTPQEGGGTHCMSTADKER